MKKLLIILLLSLPSFGATVFVSAPGGSVSCGADGTQTTVTVASLAGAWLDSNVYRLCGAFTANTGTIAFTISGGAGAATVTVQAENNFALTADYMGTAATGGIVIARNFVQLDGQSVGTISNTANGTALANQKPTTAIYVNSALHDIEIENWTISAMYASGGANAYNTDSVGLQSAGIIVLNPSTTGNILVHNNTVSAAYQLIEVNFQSSSNNLQVYSNTLTDSAHHIQMVNGASTTPTPTNVNIYSNTITNWDNWFCPAFAAFCGFGSAAWSSATTYSLHQAVSSGGSYYISLQNTNLNHLVTDTSWWAKGGDAYHTDGIFIFNTRGVVNPPVINVYNNYIHGDLGSGSATAFIACTYGNGLSGNAETCVLYNNRLDLTGTGRGGGISLGTAAVNNIVENNTITNTCTGSGCDLIISCNGNSTIKNNVGVGGTVAVIGNSGCTYAGSTAAEDNNVWYNVNGGATRWAFNNVFYNLAQWKALATCGGGSSACNYDANSATTTPKLDANDIPTDTGSSAYQRGANLYSAGILGLRNDYNGAARVAGGSWDAGAFNVPGSPPWTLAVGCAGSGNGSFDTGSHGITGVCTAGAATSCSNGVLASGQCTASYSNNATETVTFTNTSGVLNGVSGSCITNGCTVTMTQAQTVTGSFTLGIVNTVASNIAALTCGASPTLSVTTSNVSGNTLASWTVTATDTTANVYPALSCIGTAPNYTDACLASASGPPVVTPTPSATTTYSISACYGNPQICGTPVTVAVQVSCPVYGQYQH